MVLLEGCGAGALELAGGVAALLWLEVSEEDRRLRLQGRQDWASYQPFYSHWAAQESFLYRRDRPDERADVVVEAIDPPTAGGPLCDPPAVSRTRLQLRTPATSRLQVGIQGRVTECHSRGRGGGQDL